MSLKDRYEHRKEMLRRLKKLQIALHSNDEGAQRAVAESVDWDLVIEGFEDSAGRSANAVYRYSRRIIRNLRRPYMLYQDCLQLSIDESNFRRCLQDSPSLVPHSGKVLDKAFAWAIRREALRDQLLPGGLLKNQYSTLDILFAAIKQKLQRGQDLERAKNGAYVSGQRVYDNVPRLFSWVVWCADPAWPEENNYGFTATERLIFGGEIPNMYSHCILWNIEGKMFAGFHTPNFRELTEDEI